MLTRSILMALSICLASHARVPAQEPADPLRFIPDQAHIVVKMDHPAQTIQALYQHDAAQSWLKIEGIRDFFDTTNFRRLLQIRDYYEKKLGMGGMELLDCLTAGGVVLAVRTNAPPAVVVVIQGKDEALLKQFMQLSVGIVEQELARQESKDKVTPRKFGSVAGYEVGKLSVAAVGSALVLASDPLVLQVALGQAGQKTGNIAGQPRFSDAMKLLPKNPLLWAWVDFESVRKIEGFKTGLDAAALDTGATLAIGGLVDMAVRTPYLVSSIAMEGQNIVLEHRLPVGRKGMNPKAALFQPAEGKGALPLLQPAGVLASLSFVQDLKVIWEKRATLFDKMQVKGLEDLDEKSALFLAGSRMSKLLQEAGAHQRIVVAQPGKSPYKTKPQQPIPAFALVQEMRDPAFGKTMETVLRGAAVLGGFKFGFLKMVEEKHGPYTVIAYYFPEDKDVSDDPGYLRLNYSPSFAIVKDQLIVSSTAELVHQLIDALTAEKDSTSSESSTRIALFGKGGASLLRAGKEQILAQAILSQALPPAVARKQVESFITFAERLGELQFDIRYGQNDFRYAIRWQYAP